jgi:cellobiose phosphorylase
MPRKWSTFTVHYRYRQTPYHIRITRLPSTPPGGSRLTFDGQALAGNTISLLDDHRDHSVEMELS